MHTDDGAYFQRRLNDERRRAAASLHPEIAGIPRQLASRYEDALAGLRSAGPHPDDGLASP